MGMFQDILMQINSNDSKKKINATNNRFLDYKVKVSEITIQYSDYET